MARLEIGRATVALVVAIGFLLFLLTRLPNPATTKPSLSQILERLNAYVKDDRKAVPDGIHRYEEEMQFFLGLDARERERGGALRRACISGFHQGTFAAVLLNASAELFVYAFDPSFYLYVPKCFEYLRNVNEDRLFLVMGNPFGQMVRIADENPTLQCDLLIHNVHDLGYDALEILMQRLGYPGALIATDWCADEGSDRGPEKAWRAAIEANQIGEPNCFDAPATAKDEGCRLAKYCIGRQTIGPARLETEPIFNEIGFLAGSNIFEQDDGSYERYLRGQTNPNLKLSHFSNIQARSIQDPCLFQRKGEPGFYLFVSCVVRDENTNEDRSVIALTMSADARTWSAPVIVARRPYSMLFPQVFEHDGGVYMTASTPDTGSVNLYKAELFPGQWELHSSLVTDKPHQLDNPVIFSKDGLFWMFATALPSSLRLFYSKDLLEGWKEHQSSPVVDDIGSALSAGRVVLNNNDGHLVRFGQDNRRVVGGGVRSFTIKTLSRSQYIESEVVPEWNYLRTGWRERRQSAFSTITVPSTLLAPDAQPGTWYLSGTAGGNVDTATPAKG